MKAQKLQWKVYKLKTKKGKELCEKQEKKQKVGEKKNRAVSFLCRDENSRMLSGKKDTDKKN